jgi:flagellin-like hook-associated protein FlgL
VQLSNGDSTNANVPGDQLFLNASGSVFGALQGLNAALLSGNNLPAAVTQIQTALSTVDTQRVFYGNVLNQVTQSQNFLNQDKVNLSSQENNLVGANPAAAATAFAEAQLASTAVLSAAGRILSLPNLLAFLK